MLPMADKQAYLWLKLHERNLRITSEKRRVWTANACLLECVVCSEDSRHVRCCWRQSTSGEATEDNHLGRLTQGGCEGSICFSFSQCGSFPMAFHCFHEQEKKRLVCEIQLIHFSLFFPVM